MKQDKLISMVDFVKWVNEVEVPNIDNEYEAYNAILKYANFLSQPLTLGMFVPCLDGVVLEEPLDWRNKNSPLYKPYKCQQYQQAKERVLFEGVQVIEDRTLFVNSKEIGMFTDGKFIYFGVSTIEDLVKYNPTLTETALKQIGLNN